MTNSWLNKYSTLNDRQKLGMIKEGDVDVYNTEKQLNAKNRKSFQDAGVSTQAIDNWDAAIDRAYLSAVEKAKKKAESVIPRYEPDKYSDINSEMNKTLRSMRKQKEEDTESAKENAKKALAYLEEWLSYNGYSDKGQLSRTSKKQIDDSLKEILESIENDYKDNVKNTLSSYSSLVGI